MRVQQQSRRDKWAGLPEEQRWLFVADDLDLHDELIEDVKRTASRMVWAVMVAAVSFAGQLIIVLSTIRGK